MTNEEAIKMLKSKMDGNTDTSYEWCECVRLAIKALEQTRTKGTWIGEESLDGSIRYMCDNCKEFEYVDYYNFCPNCGADMRGEEE